MGGREIRINGNRIECKNHQRTKKTELDTLQGFLCRSPKKVRFAPGLQFSHNHLGHFLVQSAEILILKIEFEFQFLLP